MTLLKATVLFILALYVFYRIGLLVNKIFKSHNYLSVLLYGFATVAAILQIVSIPMILLHVSFTTVIVIMAITLLSVLILSFVKCKKDEEIKLLNKNITKLKAIKKKNIAITVIVFLIIISQAITSSLLFNENADDAFYVSLMEDSKVSDSIYTKAPSLGSDNTTFLSRYMVSGYELSMAVISKIFSIPATILTHTITPFIMIIFAYMSYYVLARKFFNNEKSTLFVFILSILFLFSGFTTRFRGIILLSRMWQGKEIFLNIILNLILANLISLNNYNRRKNLIALTILNFSAVFFTNTAIFLVPFAYLGFGIIALIKREKKNFLGMVLTGIPIAIYAAIYLLIAQNIRGSNYHDVNIFEIFKNYIGTGYYFILYIISLVIIAIKGSKRAKKYFLVIPVIYLLTIYNPIFTKIIVSCFTGSEVFWRLFWLLPIEFSIGYAFVLTIYCLHNKYCKVALAVIEILLLVFLGKFVYTEENGFEKAENLSKIPQTIIEQTEYILANSSQEKIVVMAPPEPLHSATMRQITPKINLFWSRDLYMYEITPQEQLQEMEKIHKIYTSVPEISAEEFDQIRKDYGGVNWIIIECAEQEKTNYLDKTEFIKKAKIGEYYLYQY